MLSVQPVFDHETILVEIVEDFVRILKQKFKDQRHGLVETYLGHRCCENDNFVVEGQLLEELNGTRSDEVVVTIFVVTLVMNERLV